MIRETCFRHADFVVLYVGGNDLDRGDDPREIASHIKDLVLLLQENVASVVLVFKVLPRHFDEPRKAQFEDRRRRQLNRRLSATLKRLSGVHILNPEHRFLDVSGKPMLSLFAADRYHVARDRGIDQMSDYRRGPRQDLRTTDSVGFKGKTRRGVRRAPVSSVRSQRAQDGPLLGLLLTAPLQVAVEVLLQTALFRATSLFPGRSRASRFVPVFPLCRNRRQTSKSRGVS
ncbi:uncharacterized protein LOC144122070 [Amblyomma americanum]